MVQLHLETSYLLRALQNKNIAKLPTEKVGSSVLVFFYFGVLMENILPSFVAAPDTGMNGITDLVADEFCFLTDGG